MDYREKIKQFIEIHGPALPVQIAKSIKKESMLASAMLSEMVSKKILKLTYMKIGASPLYYLPNQSEQILRFLSHLNEKEREVIELIKQKKILHDKILQPIERVIIQTLKDFAIPVTVHINSEKKLFWKWFLITDEDAKKSIIDILQIKKDKLNKKNNEPKTDNQTQPEKIKNEIIKEKNNIKQKEQQSKIGEIEITKVTKKTVKKTSKQKTKKTNEESGKKILEFFKLTESKIISTLPEKSSKERDYIVEFETPFGPLKVFSRIVLKKRIRSVDLNSAIIESTKHRLSLLFVIDGVLSKKAKEQLKKDFPGVLVKNLQ